MRVKDPKRGESRTSWLASESRLRQGLCLVDVIPECCADHEFDIAVMSDASLDHPLGRLLGSTIENTIEKLTCGLMVVKPQGFRSLVANKKAQTAGLNL